MNSMDIDARLAALYEEYKIAKPNGSDYMPKVGETPAKVNQDLNKGIVSGNNPQRAEVVPTALKAAGKRMKIQSGANKALPVYANPSFQSNSQKMVNNGTLVQLIENKGKLWHHIAWDGGEGWIYGNGLVEENVQTAKPSGKSGAAKNGAAVKLSGGGHRLASEAMAYAKSKVNTKYTNGTMTYCQQFVGEAAGYAIGPAAKTIYSGGSAKSAAAKWGKNTSQGNIPIGAAVYFNSNTTNGKKFGHVGIYAGDGKVYHVGGSNVKGAVGLQSIASITRVREDKKRKYTFKSWGWHGGIELEQDM